MFFQIKSYIKFLWQSKNEHGVHSPFAFDLVTKCFYDKKSKPDLSRSEQAKQYQILKNYRNSLLKNKSTLEVSDFGAGSKVFKSNTRTVSKVAKTAGISQKRAELLFRVAHYFQPSTILELGTSLGLATSALALGAKNASITTIEGCQNTMAIAKKELHLFKFDTIECITSEFNDHLNNCKLKTENCQLIFFDGNHSKTATLQYFELLLPTITNETVWIFDDIHWSAEMEEAWQIIKKHPKVTVTLDTFRWGMVFFRREQAKEHFVIRV